MILHGQVLEQLKLIPNESIDCVISSPPYWALRDYSVEGQWGLEKDFREFLQKMGLLMDELKRIIKKTGTCWINLGDTYNGTGDKSNVEDFGKQNLQKGNNDHLRAGLEDDRYIQRKSRFGIPERFYIQCIDSGWVARNHIVWYKSNAMPSSVKDRFTNHWESVFFFAKTPRYYFNLNAVREKPKTETKPFNLRVKEAKKGRGQLKLGEDPRAWKASLEELEGYNTKGEKTIHEKYEDESHLIKTRLHRDRSGNPNRKQDSVFGSDGKPKVTYSGFNERWAQSRHRESLHYADFDGYNPSGKNPGDCFFINPKPFPEAHFATFPEELPLKILRCACPQHVCSKCKKPREPILKPTPEYQKYLDSIKGLESGNLEKGYQNYKNETQSTTEYEAVVDWTKCKCGSEFNSGIVLDPFFGAGTVAVAAEQLGLNWCGVELKQEYIDIARKRLEPYKTERLI